MLNKYTRKVAKLGLRTVSVGAAHSYTNALQVHAKGIRTRHTRNTRQGRTSLHNEQLPSGLHNPQGSQYNKAPSHANSTRPRHTPEQRLPDPHIPGNSRAAHHSTHTATGWAVHYLLTDSTRKVGATARHIIGIPDFAANSM